MHFPRFRYTNDSATIITLDLSLAARPWVPGSGGVGGREFSAARVPAGYELRRDEELQLTIRFTEQEWAALHTMLKHGQRGTLITVWPSYPGVSRDSYLITPTYEEKIRPRRLDYPGDMEIVTSWVDNTDTGWDGVLAYG